MRELAQYVVDNELSLEEIEKVNKEVKNPEEQVELLNRKSTNLFLT